MAERRRRAEREPRPDPDNMPVMFRKGLSDRMENKSGGGFSLQFDTGKAQLVQFLTDPDGFLEFEQHQFQGQGGWKYVPCPMSFGKPECPLCEDEDPEVSKLNYRFVAPVYSFSDKETRVLEGPKTLAQRVAFRWSNCVKREQNFRQKTFEITKVKGVPWWDVDAADDPPVSTRSMDKPDLEAYVIAGADRFFGNSGGGSHLVKATGNGGRTSLDADDDEEDMDEDQPHTKSELREMSSTELKDIARGLRINTRNYTSRADLIAAIMKKER